MHRRRVVTRPFITVVISEKIAQIQLFAQAHQKTEYHPCQRQQPPHQLSKYFADQKQQICAHHNILSSRIELTTDNTIAANSVINTNPTTLRMNYIEFWEEKPSSPFQFNSPKGEWWWIRYAIYNVEYSTDALSQSLDSVLDNSIDPPKTWALSVSFEILPQIRYLMRWRREYVVEMTIQTIDGSNNGCNVCMAHWQEWEMMSARRPKADILLFREIDWHLKPSTEWRRHRFETILLIVNKIEILFIHPFRTVLLSVTRIAPTIQHSKDCTHPSSTSAEDFSKSAEPLETRYQTEQSRLCHPNGHSSKSAKHRLPTIWSTGQTSFFPVLRLDYFSRFMFRRNDNSSLAFRIIANTSRKVDCRHTERST